MSPRETPVERVGDVAQLGERLNRTQEADGSIPFISTIFLLFSRQKRTKTGLGNDWETVAPGFPIVQALSYAPPPAP
jgi:hypothetical protein